MVLDDDEKIGVLRRGPRMGPVTRSYRLSVAVVLTWIGVALCWLFMLVIMVLIFSGYPKAELEENLWDFSYYSTENIRLAYKHEYFLDEHIHYSVAVSPYVPKHSRFRWWHPEKRKWYYFVARDCIGKDGRQFWHDRYAGDKLLGRSRIDFPKRTWMGVLDGRPARGLIKEQEVEWLEWGDTYYYKDVPLAASPIVEEEDDGN